MIKTAWILKREKDLFAVIRGIIRLLMKQKNFPGTMRSRYPEIPKNGMVGMHDKRIHEYFGVDVVFPQKTIQQDLPKF